MKIQLNNLFRKFRLENLVHILDLLFVK